MKKKVVKLVNIVAPYRVPVYEVLGDAFDFVVLTSGSESNRGTWEDNLGNAAFRARQSKGWSFTIWQKQKGKAFYPRYMHITVGYFFDLIKERPAAVISIEMGFRTLIAWLYCLLWRKPLWVWWGGTLVTEAGAGRVKRVLRKFFSKVVPRWISYGETSTEYLESLGIARSKILTIQNCVDHRKFSKLPEPRFADLERPVGLVVGQMVPLKGLDALLETLKRLKDNGKEFDLLLVGGGPFRDHYMEMATTMGLSRVKFVDALKPQEMPSVFASADFLIFPTLADVWGLVANEAILSGIPVLCSTRAGCYREVVPESNWFDPLDPDQFEKKLEEALEGKLAPADPTRLKTFDAIGAMIAEDIQAKINS